MTPGLNRQATFAYLFSRGLSQPSFLLGAAPEIQFQFRVDDASVFRGTPLVSPTISHQDFDAT
jgi:hypothetical protein